MKASRITRAIARLFATRPIYTVRHYTPAEYLRSRAAGADLVRVEGER